MEFQLLTKLQKKMKKKELVGEDSVFMPSIVSSQFSL
jgi:hypothetical protein